MVDGREAGARVLVVTGPGLVADGGLLESVAAAECAALGVTGRVVAAAGPDAFAGALAGAGDDEAVVALPGPDPDVRRLMEAPSGHAPRTVWLDLARVGPVPVASGAARMQGRGVLGLVWAIRHAVHRLRRPARRIAYGGHADQWGDLRLPSPAAASPPEAGASPTAGAPPAAGAAVPVAVLVHGGYWRSIWEADLMDALAIDLADRGYAAWNIEYRRPDPHGWAATTEDVASAIEALGGLGVPLDLNRIAVIGHSAGGQLALRAAADTHGKDMHGKDMHGKDMHGKDAGGTRAAGDPRGGHPGVRIALAVSLAGVVDLVEGDRRRVGNGAVADALGGGADGIPEVYAAASPLARLPLGVPQLVVQGASDDLDLLDAGRRYARAAGEEAVYLELPGDHFDVIDPATPIWKATADHLAACLRPAADIP
ncbi:alpha/beta hydrolase [Sphaerisporangium corydalis]|uniref:Alpha/beta hydrolase n=1 Tax=Sphaerisporangium corydalis TaxID=1441875 RepID=A0ABV9EKV9_9ACTN|nr:alpha/beta hydrolase [Sphaerisporangium corydalis]